MPLCGHFILGGLCAQLDNQSEIDGRKNGASTANGCNNGQGVKVSTLSGSRVRSPVRALDKCSLKRALNWVSPCAGLQAWIKAMVVSARVDDIRADNQYRTKLEIQCALVTTGGTTERITNSKL